MGNARQKLNAAVLNGCVIIAGLVAGLTQSWTVFTVLLGLLLFSSWLSRDLRGGRR